MTWVIILADKMFFAKDIIILSSSSKDLFYWAFPLSNDSRKHHRIGLSRLTAPGNHWFQSEVVVARSGLDPLLSIPEDNNGVGNQDMAQHETRPVLLIAMCLL